MKKIVEEKKIFDNDGNFKPFDFFTTGGYKLEKEYALLDKIDKLVYQYYEMIVPGITEKPTDTDNPFPLTFLHWFGHQDKVKVRSLLYESAHNMADKIRKAAAELMREEHKEANVSQLLDKIIDK